MQQRLSGRTSLPPAFSKQSLDRGRERTTKPREGSIRRPRVSRCAPGLGEHNQASLEGWEDSEHPEEREEVEQRVERACSSQPQLVEVVAERREGA